MTNLWRWWFVFVLFLQGAVFAGTISDLNILKVGFRHAVGEYFFLDISGKIVMSDEQVSILSSGIPLTFIYEIKVKEKIFLDFKKTKVDEKIKLMLRYHGLSKQYVVKNIGKQQQESYPTLTLALSEIENINNITIQLRQRQGVSYEGSVKLWLDIEALPAPLRIPAYLSKQWRLNSGWKTWDLTQ